ncbi:RND family efflux transporter, MFP subunit [Sphaerochaeta pleomorpha str. Grapes]|uniref:RND family efflux transporter, MFP subunit n=1 Tax=Sphaerochaeta pleomorpha (strain ATCC BAA-1885 / DSM 22778 / Grapes) TaxID=158190 RepID=G8QQV8_SPHPG|nr:efflux RND transporter periplasmic adaptor subunit [Sphaerochaeta pleomorpha]AEV28739.1 RND family efflux transporter, MFP subunit [Sphaerochaeta pleomorpha str. Grapes]
MEKKPLFDTIVTLILVAICIILAAIIANNLLGNGTESKQMPMQRTEQQQSSVNVSVEPVKTGMFTKTTTIGAELQNSRETVSLTSSLVGGKLTSLTIKEGDSVQAGDSIGTVDPSTPGNQYKETSITAPVGGIVYSVDSYVGEQITTNTVLATLGQGGDLEIIAYLPERFLSTVEIGSKATFTTAAWPEESAEATVKMISPSINTSNRTFTVTLSVDKSDPRFKEGMYVKLNLITEEIDNCLTIPTDAITTYLGNPVVFIAQDGKAKRIDVTTSSSDGNRSVVTSGLNGDEQVIVAGSVVDGSSIKIIEEQV